MTQAQKLSFGTKATYGLGQLGEGLIAGGVGTFLLFYYVQVLGLAPALASLALGGTLIFDAFIDPIAGSISDNFHSRLGRRHPFMFAAIVPAAIALVLLFWPQTHSQFGMFLWLATCLVLYRCAMSFFNVPHLSLGAEMATNFEERTSIVGFRQFSATFGGVFAVIVGFQFFFMKTPQFANGQLNIAGYPPYALLLGVCVMAALLTSALGTRKLIPRLPQPLVRAQSRSALQVLVQVFWDTALALQNKSFRWSFIGVLIVFVMVGVDAALNLHMNTYYWELTGQQISLLALATPIGVMLGTTITKTLHRLWDKKPGVVWGTAWWSVCQIVPIVLRMLDWFPHNHTTALVVTLVVVRFLQGFGVVQALVSFGSIMADIADEHELLTGRRQEGIFFGAVSFSGKCATGSGNMVAGLGLWAISWPLGTQIKTAADVPSDVLFNLGLLFGPIVAGFAVVAVWCYSHLSLDRARHAIIVTELEKRRAAAATPTARLGGAALGGAALVGGTRGNWSASCRSS